MKNEIIKEPLTESQIKEAINVLTKWFPEEANSINSKEELIIENIINGSIETSSLLTQQEYSFSEKEELLGFPKSHPVKKP